MKKLMALVMMGMLIGAVSAEAGPLRFAGKVVVSAGKAGAKAVKVAASGVKALW